jgi:hypothetical protein
VTQIDRKRRIGERFAVVALYGAAGMCGAAGPGCLSTSAPVQIDSLYAACSDMRISFPAVLDADPGFLPTRHRGRQRGEIGFAEMRNAK